MSHFIAGIYSLIICRSKWEPHDGDDGVNDEGEKHVLMEGDSLAAETPGRDNRQQKEM